MKCPDCDNELEEIVLPLNSMLNEDQFESVKAGDFVCYNCPPNGRSKSPYKYFWKSELYGK